MPHPWEAPVQPPAAAAGAPCGTCGRSASAAAKPAETGTTGAFVTLGASLVGVSGSLTVDSKLNVYATTGVGAVLPSAGIVVGRFRSKGSPEDLFVGDSMCVASTTPGAKLGMEACWNDSGESIGAAAGIGSPHSLQKTTTRKLSLPKTDDALMEIDPMGNWTMPRASGM